MISTAQAEEICRRPATQYPAVRSLSAWTTIGVAAAAMVATMPGRTHGLGIITVPLLADLQLDDVSYAHMNLWATLIGALACFPAGRLIDRIGVRGVLLGTSLLLGATVAGMSALVTAESLFVFILLTRALGQSALSIVSIAVVGKAFDRKLAWPMAAYSVLMSIGFMAVFPLAIHGVEKLGWRPVWGSIGGWLLLIMAPAALLLSRDDRDTKSQPEQSADDAASSTGFDLQSALASPLFWVFALSTSLFGLASSGIGLFNQRILAERELVEFYKEFMALSALVGLLGQAACGMLARVLSYQKITALAMFVYAAALVGLTQTAARAELNVCCALLGFSGGILTVIFFAAFGRAFGKRHLGRIQGAAQMLTVLASAAGPLVFAQCHDRTGTYAGALYGLAAVVTLLGAAAMVVSTPKTLSESAR